MRNNHADTELVRIDEEQRLYVLRSTAGYVGYTCLGFDRAYDHALKVAAWCNVPGPAVINVGTPDGYRDYARIMHEGAFYALDTGKRCDADLIPAFIGREGERVEVQTPDGEVRRYYIGKSVGWMPCHLEIARKGSHGGSGVYVPTGSTVRFLGTRL